MFVSPIALLTTLPLPLPLPSLKNHKICIEFLFALIKKLVFFSSILPLKPSVLTIRIDYAMPNNCSDSTLQAAESLSYEYVVFRGN